MKQQASPLWTTGSTEVRMTGTWRSAVPEYRTAPAPCFGACPVNGRIAEWIGQAGHGDYHGAWLTLVENNPFPAVAGRICHHPCESACNRLQLDEAVSICSLERFVGDMALDEGWQLPPVAHSRDRSVAVVGSGPAGLSAVYQLRRRGFSVALIEAQDQLGGLMRYGIPAYRLDQAVLDGEIQRIIELGVEVHLQSELAGGEALQDLRSQYDAVYLAVGAARSRTLPGLDYSQPWVVDGADFLAAANSGDYRKPGERLVVIGGGSAAMDVARSARRLDMAVTVLALESETRLPAQREEVIEALEEGVEFVCGAMMQTAGPGADGLTLNCIRVDFQPTDAGAGFAVEPLCGSEFTLAANAVILSIGQEVDLCRWGGVLEGDGQVVRTDHQWQTTAPGIFAGGDLASTDRFVTSAVGMGKQAALEIERFLDGGPAAADAASEPEAPFSVINTHYHPPAARHQAAKTEVTARLRNFLEVQGRLDEAEAAAEAARCFSCGLCIFCDNCYFYCPDMAITRLDRAYEVKTDYCKGCGLCVAECPTGSIVMREEQQEQK